MADQQSLLAGGGIPLSLLAGVLLVAVMWEVLWPRRKVQASVGFRWTQNLSLGVLNHLVVYWLYAMVGMGAGWWASRQGTGLFGQLQMSLLVEVLVTLLVLELLGYWLHRLMHEINGLWHLHTVHHSDTELDFSTTYRNHPFETAFVTLLSIPLIILMAPNVIAITVYQMIRLCVNLLAHSNVYLPRRVDRVLRLVIVTPDFHRVHHCPDPAFTNSNYGTVVPWFDYLFGTAREKPFAEQSTMPLGLEYFQDPADSRFLQLLWMPFRQVPQGPA